jgi:hypothetical protein
MTTPTNPAPDVDYDDDFSDDGCYRCGGRGWEVRCIDDMCHGQDECIHGDLPDPCPVCNPEGDNLNGMLY